MARRKGNKESSSDKHRNKDILCFVAVLYLKADNFCSISRFIFIHRHNEEILAPSGTVERRFDVSFYLYLVFYEHA